MKYIALFISTLLMFAFLLWTENTNYQIIGIALAVLALPAILLSRAGRKKAEPQPAGSSRREFLMAGASLGLLTYFGSFIAQRAPNSDMADFTPMLEPIDIDLKIDPQESFSLEKPQASIPDGPFYTLNTPESRNIAATGTVGKPLIFQGRIVDQQGKPLEGAVIEIWHADGNGDYDNQGYNCRGHQFTNADGCFEFLTVKPKGYGKRSLSLAGLIDYRSAHIHIKIKKDDRFQTSQLWFPDDPRNAEDIGYQLQKDTSTINQQLVGGALLSRFDFIL